MADATPKLFISYSWTSTEHGEWVLNLAAGRVIAHIKSHVSPKASADDRMRQFILADLTFMDQ